MSTRGSCPIYVVPADKKAQVAKLRKAIKTARDLYLATDEDREGEAISWHLFELLKPKIPVHRLVFHEITKEAIDEALAHPRDIDEGLVRAQETRRILDRLYGYEVSPLLVAENRAAVVRRSRAERGGAVDRGARAGANGVHRGQLLGSGRGIRGQRGCVPGRSGLGRRTSDSSRAGLRPADRAS